MKIYVITLFGFVASCSYPVEDAARTVAAPSDITHVAAISLNESGQWTSTTPLLPRSDANPFSGTVAAGADGSSLRLVGYTDAQLAACAPVPGVRITTSPMRPGIGTSLDLPEPAWRVGGEWQDGLVDLAPIEEVDAMTADWISADVTACTIWDVKKQSVPYKGTAILELPFDDRVIRFLNKKGEMYDVDVDTLDVQPAGGSTITPYIGGFVAKDQQMWMFTEDGRVDRMRRGETAVTVRTDGPWGDDVNRVWANGVGVGDDIELVVMGSRGGIWRLAQDRWTKLNQVEPPPIRSHILRATILTMDNDDVWVVSEGSFDAMLVRDGVTSFESATSTEFGSPYGLAFSETYGLLLGTSVGTILRRSSSGVWTVFRASALSGGVVGIHEVDEGLLLATTGGFFDYYKPGVPPCDRLGDGSYQASVRAVFGRRMVVSRSATDLPSEVVAWDLEFSPFGCGVAFVGD